MRNSSHIFSGVSIQLQPSKGSRKISNFNIGFLQIHQFLLSLTKTALFFQQNAEGLSAAEEFYLGFGECLHLVEMVSPWYMSSQTKGVILLLIQLKHGCL